MPGGNTAEADYERTRFRGAWDSGQPDYDSGPSSVSGFGQEYLSTLLGGRQLSGRGNVPARIAAMQRTQQTVGNRAVQRAVQRAVPIQRAAAATESGEISEADLLPKRWEPGYVSPYNQQPPAEYDDSGTRTTEGEHIVPRGNLEALTYDPQTGQSDYGAKEYRNDSVVRTSREMALNKTHGNRGGENADNPRTAQMWERAQTGNASNYRDDVFLPSIENAKRARDATGDTQVTDEAINRGALNQDANLFSRYSAEQAGARVAARGSRVEDFNVEEWHGQTSGAGEASAQAQAQAEAQAEGGQAHGSQSWWDRTVNRSEERNSANIRFVAGLAQGIPVLEDIANEGARHAETANEFMGGFNKGAGSFVEGLANMAQHPDQVLMGLENMGEHVPTEVLGARNPLKVAHGLYDQVVNDDSTRLDQAMNITGEQAWNEDMAFKKQMDRAYVKPHVDSIKEGKPGEAWGRGAFEVFKDVGLAAAGAGIGEVAEGAGAAAEAGDAASEAGAAAAQGARIATRAGTGVRVASQVAEDGAGGGAAGARVGAQGVPIASEEIPEGVTPGARVRVVDEAALDEQAQMDAEEAEQAAQEAAKARQLKRIALPEPEY